MSNTVAKWIDKHLAKGVPDNVVAFCFNLYEESDGSWAMEIIGSERFDSEDEDWACNELTDFGSRKKLYTWKMDCEWEEALAYMTGELNEYLENGKYAALLKSRTAVGIGFVDGNIEILYSK